jgi:hypothetical protein
MTQLITGLISPEGAEDSPLNENALSTLFLSGRLLMILQGSEREFKGGQRKRKRK